MGSGGGSNSFARVMKLLKEGDADSQISALTSLRRSHIEDKNMMKELKDDEFCQLCNSVINATATDNERLHIEACRTLDIVLPESKDKEFDFFQSTLQTNRKKRHKILVSLRILKDETVAAIAKKHLSIINFLTDCLQSIQPNSMIWLLQENADNEELLKEVDNRVSNEAEEYEEKLVEEALRLLAKLCKLSSLGLNVRQFDKFIMEKVVPLSYMGHKKQRSSAMKVLVEAVHHDLGTRVRSFNADLWAKYKNTLQAVYCKRMTLLVKVLDQDWSLLWETTISFIGTDLHKGSQLVNSLLKVEEIAFKSVDSNRRQAFLSWKVLIDNFALDPRELATPRRIRLLCTPLTAKNSKTEQMVLTKLEVWWHLIYKVYPSVAECIDSVLLPFLNICFGPLGDKPLFVTNAESNVSLGKKFKKTLIFGIDAFIQLIVSRDETLSLDAVQEKLITPVSNAVFEKLHKTFIYSFGEVVFALGCSFKDISNKMEICQVLWNNLIQRIEEYDKMKVEMYKEVTTVVVEMFSHKQNVLVKDFLLAIMLENHNEIACHMRIPETVLIELIKMFLHLDNFPGFTAKHYQSMEALLWHLIKPKNADVFYPRTMELFQEVLATLNESVKCHQYQTCEMWCVLARVAKKYVEDSQNINEGTRLNHNFKTTESILALPFNSFSTNDQQQLINMTKAWTELYKQLDFQAELIVTVQPHEILEKTSEMILKSLQSRKDENCYVFASLCSDGLFDTVNYEKILSDDKVPSFVILLKDLILQNLKSKSITSDKILKTMSTFLLMVFNLSNQKTALQRTASYLNILAPAVQCMMEVIDNSLEKSIVDTWSTITGQLFRKLNKFLSSELLRVYRPIILSALLHCNSDISRAAFSILEISDGLDKESVKILKEIMDEVNKSSAKDKMNSSSSAKANKKLKSPQVKPIGSFLDRKSNTPSGIKVQNGKENVEKSRVIDIEPESQDYVTINNDLNIDVKRLTEHQKEMLKRRRDDIPAMYNDLTVSNSQDSQQLQYWFDAKTGKSPASSRKEDSAPSQESPSTLHFKNITKAFASKDEEKQTRSSSSSSSSSVTSPKASGAAKKLQAPLVTTTKAAAAAAATAVQQQQQQTTTAAAATIEDVELPSIVEYSQNRGEVDEDESTPAVIVPKKLDFESREEFPAPAAVASATAADTEQQQQVSPSIIDNKMRRSTNQRSDDAKALDKAGRTRRSLLQRSSSSEQLNKRGRKRRNSEVQNSESPLDIEREKRPRRENESAAAVASSESSEERSSDSQEMNEKKLPKRTKCEMSRLKIDMKFEKLPHRRSYGKSSDGPAADKKSTSKEEKSMTKTDSQQSVNAAGRSRRSLGAPEAPKKDEHSGRANARKSLPGKFAVPAQKKSDIVQETQESMIIEDVTTQNDKVAEDVSDTPDSETQETEESGSMSSQDPDIVESSQEPSGVGSKLDKNLCFVKINKVDVEQISKETEESSEKEERESEPSQSNLDEVSFVPGTIPSEKTTTVQDSKKAEVVSVIKASTIPSSNTSSPKSSKPRVPKTTKFIPPQGRAAQILAFVTKQSISEKSMCDLPKLDLPTNLSEEVTIVPIPKKDRTPSRNEPQAVSSPGGSRQEKMFNNMNNNRRQDFGSPSLEKFHNLKNDGERISPKLDKNQRESEIDSCENNVSNSGGDVSPNNRQGKELPMFEWNTHPPSLSASPSVSILKRYEDMDGETSSRKKRVSFADPPVSREMGYQIEGSESSSPPKLEKLPSIRSPLPRREPRKYVKQRLIQIEQDEMMEKENDVVVLSNFDKSVESAAVTDELNSVVNVPKAKIAAALTTISIEESKMVVECAETNSNTQDADMFMDNNGSAENDSVEAANKTSSQTDQNNSLIKIDSINLSNIVNKSNSHQVSLEDTVDVDNMSSSIESMNSDKPLRSGSTQSTDPGDTLPATDSVFSNPALSQETQSTVARLNEPEILDSTLPVYPSLVSCMDAVQTVSKNLVDPLFENNLAQYLSMKSINSVGDLAQLSERDINRLPIKGPYKIDCVKKALADYEKRVASLNKTPEKRVSSIVPSSTPLGNNNKRFTRNKSQNDSFDLVSNDVSALTGSQSRRPKRLSTDSSMQTSPVKKQKKNEQESFAELMDQYDEDALVNAMADKIPYEKMLRVYKNKMNGKTEKEMKKDTLSILGFSVEDDSEASFKASTKSVGLQKVLQQLPTIFDNDEGFIDNVVKAYKKQLNAEKLLNILATKLEQDKSDKLVLNKHEMKTVLDKASTDLIIDLLQSKNAFEQVAKKISTDLIVDQVQTRNEFKRVLETAPIDLIIDRLSDKNVFEQVAKKIPTDILIKQVKVRNEIKQVLDEAPSDLVIDHVQTKYNLNSSEELLNILLKNAPEELSKNTIRTLFETIQKRIELPDLSDMCSEAVRAAYTKDKQLIQKLIRVEKNFLTK